MNIDRLILLSNVTLGMKTETYRRFLHQKLSSEARLIGIKGQRRAGKTTLVKQSQGYVSPDSFTHGSSAQRVKWFKIGLASGDLNSCDTFKKF
jgi:predicted metalloprotease